MKYHPKLKYKYQLVLYFVLVLSFMALVFTIYIVQRNKDYSFKTLRDSLIKDNEKIYETVKNTYDFFYLNTDAISLGDTVRVTLIDTSHNMIYDNSNLVNITDDYAASRGMSVSWFIRNFKKYTGSTPMQFIVGIRINNAQMLLETTTYSINEISKIVGYDNQLYFSRLFHKLKGYSPREYRKIRNKF